MSPMPSLIVATMLDPLVPVAVLLAFVALIAAVAAAATKKGAAAVGWLLLSCLCGGYASLSVPHKNEGAAYEAGGVGDSRAVGSSEVAYSSSNGGYFGYTSCLGAPTS